MIFVLTSPRATTDPFAYLRAMVDQINHEGVSCEKHVVVDSVEQLAFEDLVAEDRFASWTLHRHERAANAFKGGNKLPYWHLLELALETGAGDVVALEDDLELCTNACTRMLSFPVPADVAWTQFFSAWTFRDERVAGIDPLRTWKAHPGLWRPPSMLQGCQAIKFPRRTLKELVAWRRYDEHWQMYNESDVSLGLAQQRLGMRGSCHQPDLVQHIGDSSLVAHGMLDEAGITDAAALERGYADASLGGRRSATYPGKGFDAMRLYARNDFYR